MCWKGRKQRVVSRANRIIGVCSGRWRGISLQVNETVSIIGLHPSSQTEPWTVWVPERKNDGEREREREREREITDGTVMKIGRRIMSLVVFSSSHPLSLSLSLPLSHYSEWLVGVQLHSLLLIKKPRAPFDEFIRLPTPLFAPLHPSFLPPALLSLFPSPFSFFFSFSSPSLSLNSYILPLSVSLSLPLPSVYFFHHPVERNSEKERWWGGGGRRRTCGPRQGGESKSSGEEKDNPPLWQMKLLLKKGGLSPNFLLTFFVVYFSPAAPLLPFVPTIPPPSSPSCASAPLWQIVWNQ